MRGSPVDQTGKASSSSERAVRAHVRTDGPSRSCRPRRTLRTKTQSSCRRETTPGSPGRSGLRVRRVRPRPQSPRRTARCLGPALAKRVSASTATRAVASYAEVVVSVGRCDRSRILDVDLVVSIAARRTRCACRPARRRAVVDGSCVDPTGVVAALDRSRSRLRAPCRRACRCDAGGAAPVRGGGRREAATAAPSTATMHGPDGRSVVARARI